MITTFLPPIGLTSRNHRLGQALPSFTERLDVEETSGEGNAVDCQSLSAFASAVEKRIGRNCTPGTRGTWTPQT